VGPHWSKPGETLEVVEIIASPFVRIESHTVRAGDSVVAGWLWTDTPDHVCAFFLLICSVVIPNTTQPQVNVLVENENGTFELLWQSKYGLSQPSWAVVGGYINAHESPLAAAHREVLEELGREAPHANWIYLGRYRSDASRGGGFVHSFLARNTVTSRQHRHSDDLEPQSVRVVDHTRLQVPPKQHLRSTNRFTEHACVCPAQQQQLVQHGDFAETKWTATVALALLHLAQRPGTPPALPLSAAMIVQGSSVGIGTSSSSKVFSAAAVAAAKTPREKQA
jgi:8-oxo-dGTP pyrophosphatase MutT (NUDIX family)